MKQEAVITCGLLLLSEKAMEKVEEALDHEFVFAKLQAIRVDCTGVSEGVFLMKCVAIVRELVSACVNEAAK